MFSDPNCPTRVGEIINTISEIYDIPNPSEGMQVYVRDEKKTYTITGLKEAVIGGERVPDAKVDTFEAVKSQVEEIDNNFAEMQEALSDGSFVVAVANLANGVKAGAVTFEMLDGELQLSASVVDDLETANTLRPLSANQGKVLKDLIDIINGTGEGATDKKITDAIAALVDSAPENLDTLRELAEWIEEHGAEFAKVVTDINNIKIDALLTSSVHVSQFAEKINIGGRSLDGANTMSVDIPAATTETAGVMSAEDKKKIGMQQSIYNINILTGNLTQFYTLEEARNLLLPDFRRSSTMLCFRDADCLGKYSYYQYWATDVDETLWATDMYWQRIATRIAENYTELNGLTTVDLLRPYIRRRDNFINNLAVNVKTTYSKLELKPYEVVNNKNVFSIDDVAKDVFFDTEILGLHIGSTYGYSSYSTAVVKCESDTEYVLSGLFLKSKRIALYNTYGDCTHGVKNTTLEGIIEIEGGDWSLNSDIHITTQADTEYIVFGVGEPHSPQYYLNNPIQLEKGTLSTSYIEGLRRCSSPSYKELNESKRKTIKVLFIGNSVNQDHIAYLPWLLKNTYGDDIDYTIAISYKASYTIKKYCEDILTDNVALDIFSISNNAERWTNYNNVKYSEIWNHLDGFDIISFQGYFNDSLYGWVEDPSYYAQFIADLKTRQSQPFGLGYLMHQTFNNNGVDVWKRIVEGANTAIAENPISILFPCGAVTRLLNNTEEFPQSFLTSDNIHNQQGLPCIMGAYVAMDVIARYLGLPSRVLNNKLRITQAIEGTLNIPGANGVLQLGNELQYSIAQNAAVQAVKYGERIYIDSIAGA